MKSLPTSIAIVASLCTATAALAAPVIVPDGDFSLPDRGLWQEVTGGDALYAFSYPETGGNPGAYGIIDNAVVAEASFGIWVSNDENIITLDSLGLEARQCLHLLPGHDPPLRHRRRGLQSRFLRRG